MHDQMRVAQGLLKELEESDEDGGLFLITVSAYHFGGMEDRSRILRTGDMASEKTAMILPGKGPHGGRGGEGCQNCFGTSSCGPD